MTEEIKKFTRLLTDSRSLAEPDKTLFFAIVTPTGDGHRFIPELYRRGVRGFVVRKDYEIPAGMDDAEFFRADDTLKALQQAGASRRRGAAEVVAITGSRGKTTLKEWLFQLMSPLKRITRSPRSYNSQVGVPLSLWEIQPGTEMALIEAGVSRAGEMAVLRDLIDPDTVIVTNIGRPHAEGFADMSGKAREKFGLARKAKRLIYPADNELTATAAREVAAENPPLELIGWSEKDPGAALYVSEKRESEIEYSFGGKKGRSLKVPAATRADFENSVSALALMLAEGIDEATIADRFSRLRPVGTRLNVVEGMNGCSVIEDSYTSDFSSLGPALDFMKRRASAGRSLTVILSDLDHEGSDSESEYRAMAALLESRGIDRVIGVGTEIGRYAPLFGFARESRFFADTATMTAEMSAGDFIDEMILVKGAPGFGFDEVARMLEARTHETVLEVNLDAVVENYNTYRSRLPRGTGIICMVKAGAYGAGSPEIASVLQDCGASYLAVAVLDEGIELRRRGLTMPIMVMNPRVASYAAMFANRLEPEIYSMSMLEDVIREAEKRGVRNYPIHIKLDTGMHRTGFLESELAPLMERLAGQENVELRTVFSHLATADCPDMDEYTLGQLDRFGRMTEFMLSKARKPFLRHILNSAGILRFPEHHYDLARLGIGLYGARILPESIQPAPAVVSTLRTVVINVREYEAGEAVGYARRGLLTAPARIATIPIGYADGMNRRFGNGAIRVRINGHDCPTIGNICMDACMIDVTGVEVKEGDAVEIFGTSMSVEALADAIGTIPYEILTSVSPRVKRIYYK